MFFSLSSLLAMVLVAAAPAKIPAPKPAQARLMMAAWEEQTAYDAQSEKELLELANHARAQAGANPFRTDEGLIRAAREHAVAMAERRELSHQFMGEPELAKRLAAKSSLYLVEEAENVASAQSAERAHDGLMHSVHHRENLLHPSYNVVGIGVVRRGDTLYVVQDFGDSYEKLPANESDTQISESIERVRAQSKQLKLERRETSAADREACSMGTADSIKVSQSPLASQAKRIIRYTTLQPATFPDALAKVIADNTLKAYTVGSCFSRSKSYPNGIYWVVLVFY